MVGFSWWLNGKESTCQCRRCRFDPWVRKIPWQRKWQLTPVLLPGKSHGQKSLAGYSLLSTGNRIIDVSVFSLCVSRFSMIFMTYHSYHISMIFFFERNADPLVRRQSQWGQGAGWGGSWIYLGTWLLLIFPEVTLGREVPLLPLQRPPSPKHSHDHHRALSPTH